jgi:hypothetical protein
LVPEESRAGEGGWVSEEGVDDGQGMERMTVRAIEGCRGGIGGCIDG